MLNLVISFIHFLFVSFFLKRGDILILLGKGRAFYKVPEDEWPEDRKALTSPLDDEDLTSYDRE